jgi:hypothetical protein
MNLAMTPKEARELWAHALESGEYKQGDWQLTRVVDDEDLRCLTADNDNDVPFSEIAKTIREEPKGLVDS